MSATAETFSEAVSTAKNLLHNTLRRGGSTAQARKDLTDAEQAETKERAATDKILAETEKAHADAIRKQVEAECGLLREDITAECESILPGFEPEFVIESHHLTLLLEGRARHAETLAAQDELDGDLKNLTARRVEVEGQLAALHAKPERSDTENGQAHFLVLDQADIKALIEAATAQRDALVLPDLSGLERRWKKARADARHAALKQVMTELESRLLTMAHTVSADVGLAETRHRYVPSPEMRQAVSRSIV